MLDVFSASFEVSTDTRLQKFREFSVSDTDVETSSRNFAAIWGYLKNLGTALSRSAPALLDTRRHFITKANKQQFCRSSFRRLVSAVVHLRSTEQPHFFHAASYLIHIKNTNSEKVWESAKPIPSCLKRIRKLGFLFRPEEEKIFERYSCSKRDHNRALRKLSCDHSVTCSGSFLKRWSENESHVALIMKKVDCTALAVLVRQALCTVKTYTALNAFIKRRGLKSVLSICIEKIMMHVISVLYEVR